MNIYNDLSPSIDFLIHDIAKKVSDKNTFYKKYINNTPILIKLIFNLTFCESKLFVELILEDEIKYNLAKIIKNDINNYFYLNKFTYLNQDLMCTYVLTYSIYLKIYLIVKNKYYNVISLSY